MCLNGGGRIELLQTGWKWGSEDGWLDGWTGGELSPRRESRLALRPGSSSETERKETHFGYGSEHLEIDTLPIETGSGAAGWYRDWRCWCVSFIPGFSFLFIRLLFQLSGRTYSF